MCLSASTMFSTASLALLLSACGFDSALGDQPTVTGQLEGWDLGTGFMIQGSVLKPSGALEYAIVASAPVDAAGNFSLVLPGGSVMSDLLRNEPRGFEKLPEGCMGSIQAEPQSVAFATLDLRVFQGNTDVSVRQNSDLEKQPFTGETRGEFLYADREYVETSNVSCQRSPADGIVDKATTNLHFKAGWNQTISSFSLPERGERHSSYWTGAPPEGVKWRLLR